MFVRKNTLEDFNEKGWGKREKERGRKIILPKVYTKTLDDLYWIKND